MSAICCCSPANSSTILGGIRSRAHSTTIHVGSGDGVPSSAREYRGVEATKQIARHRHRIDVRALDVGVRGKRSREYTFGYSE